MVAVRGGYTASEPDTGSTGSERTAGAWGVDQLSLYSDQKLGLDRSLSDTYHAGRMDALGRDQVLAGQTSVQEVPKTGKGNAMVKGAHRHSNAVPET
jgi:hypothetical protein